MNRDLQAQTVAGHMLQACSEHDNEVMGNLFLFFPLLHCYSQIRDILVRLTLGKIKFKSIHAAKKP